MFPGLSEPSPTRKTLVISAKALEETRAWLRPGPQMAARQSGGRSLPDPDMSGFKAALPLSIR